MALSGMTGFGRAEGALGDWTWAIEARSVNGRNLEARFKAPPGFDSLEKAIRDGAQARFQRGQVNVNVQARRNESAGAVSVNLQQLERYLVAVEPYVADGRAQKPAADGLLALRGVVEASEASDDPEARAALEQALTVSIGAALDALKAARLEEGAALTPVLGGLIDRVEALVAASEAEAAGHPAMLKDRFARRMAELLGQAADEERIVQEAAVMATKADVREELDRLAGHVAAARALMAGDGAAGRRLDFLTQEFMREANTLCSKSATPALTAIGLDLKAVIEQFREQVQNVE
jgi:uncharacterized protein (TIGR00255 family)